jgi:hypothetical protein
MNPFIQHPQEQGISYTEHLLFAMSIASRLMHSVIAFALHAVFPFIDIRPSLDLEATALFIMQKNEWISNAKTDPDHGQALAEFIEDRRDYISIDL